MDFNPLKDTIYHIGILASKVLGFSLRLELQHHQTAGQTAGFVCEGTGKNDAAFLCQWLKIGKVGRPVDSVSLLLQDRRNQESQISLERILFEQIRFHVGGIESLNRVFKRATVFVAVRHFVPPADLCLSKLPAEVDDSPVTGVRKVA